MRFRRQILPKTRLYGLSFVYVSFSKEEKKTKIQLICHFKLHRHWWRHHVRERNVLEWDFKQQTDCKSEKNLLLKKLWVRRYRNNKAININKYCSTIIYSLLNLKIDHWYILESNLYKILLEIESPREIISDSTSYEQFHYDLFIKVELIDISLNFSLNCLARTFKWETKNCKFVLVWSSTKYQR